MATHRLLCTVVKTGENCIKVESIFFEKIKMFVKNIHFGWNGNRRNSYSQTFKQKLEKLHEKLKNYVISQLKRSANRV